MLTTKALTKVIVCSALFVLLLCFILFLAIKDILSDSRFWYKHSILYKVAQDKKITKLLSQRTKGEEYYKDKKDIKGKHYTTFVTDSFISNNEIICDNKRTQEDKLNSERKVLIIFPEMLRQYDPKVLDKKDFDDVLRIVYPRDPREIEDLNEKNCRAINKLLDLGYKPENISIFGVCLGAEFIIGALNCHNLKRKLGDRKFHSVVFQNVPISRSRVGVIRTLSKLFKSLKGFVSEIYVRDIRKIPAQNINIIQTKGDELIRNDNFLIGLFSDDKYNPREYHDGKNVKIYYFDGARCPENFPMQWILPVKKHGLRLWFQNKHEHNFIGQLLQNGNLDQNTTDGAQDYLKIYDCNKQNDLNNLKNDLEPEQKPNRLLNFFRSCNSIVEQNT